jgi:hypothetical protein
MSAFIVQENQLNPDVSFRRVRQSRISCSTHGIRHRLDLGAGLRHPRSVAHRARSAQVSRRLGEENLRPTPETPPEIKPELRGRKGFLEQLRVTRNSGRIQETEIGVLCISPRKGSIQDSSRLEDDPLPLLSVLIDNMHVDEVQIDGGGTEAVATGNMENPGKRLIVLEGSEVEAL